MSTFLVLLTGAVIVAAALATVTRKNPIHAALCMLVALAGVAMMFLALRSPFLAAMQVLLYGGAIMVLFVFVIMLLTLRPEEMGPPTPQIKKLHAAVGAIALLFVLLFGISRRPEVIYELPWHAQEQARLAAAGTPVPRAQQVDFGSTEHFARFLYTDYAVPFELVTVLVLAAAAGVIVLARRPEKATLERTRLTGSGGQAS